VPRRLSHPQRKTIGLRVPDHKVLQELLALHSAPLLATTLIPPGETEPLNDAEMIREHFAHSIAAVIDAGACPSQPTTVIDMTGGASPSCARDAATRPSWAYRKTLSETIDPWTQPTDPNRPLRPARAVCHHGARGRARLCGPPLRRQHRGMMGRITLNPLKHIDPVGTILMPLLLYFATSGAFLFGYAKPVPVNFGNLRNPKRDMIWVALAGPGVNLLQAMGWDGAALPAGRHGDQGALLPQDGQGGVLVNLVMWVFNLFPLPPLDGGRILVGLLPWKQAHAVSRVEPWGFFIVMGLVMRRRRHLLAAPADGPGLLAFIKLAAHPPDRPAELT
jgi:Zn-dependent protease